MLAEAAPWLDYDEQANRNRRPLERDATMSVQMRELIRYATLAANGHNTQPWKFAIQADAIEIQPDYTRGLPIVDPNHRELWISLGCALENLLVAARSTGYGTEVTYPTAAESIHIRLTADTPSPVDCLMQSSTAKTHVPSMTANPFRLPTLPKCRRCH